MTVAIRANLAYECGDLRMTYTLPAIRYRNQTRAPVFVYNSQHAKPTPIVRAWVTRQPGSWQANYVTARLKIQGITYASATWLATGFAEGVRQQIALSFDASNMVTNLYPYTLELLFDYGDRQETVVATGELAIVNRSQSEFGPGWWLTGYERIMSVQNDDMLWIGGDGSTRKYVYSYTATNTWMIYKAAPLAGADSLIYTRDGFWRRPLSRGAYVKFDASGRHVETVSELGLTTRFIALYGCTRLGVVQLPDPTGQKPFAQWQAWWSVNYDTDNNASPCVGQAHMNSSAAVGSTQVMRWTWRSIGSAGGSFTHAPGAASTFYTESSGRIVTMTDPRGVQTTITYGAGGLIENATTYLQATANHNVSQWFRAAEGAALAAPAVAADTYTALYSPRWEVQTPTKLWVGPWGNPLTIVDPLGRTTSILPDDAFPLLAKRVTAPSGYSRYALYTTDGKLRYTIGDAVNGQTPESYYRYLDPVYPDNLTSSTDAAGVTTTYEYQAIAPGLYPMVSAQQTGSDPLARIGFAYCQTTSCFGLPSASLSGADGQGARSRDSLGYDANGNLTLTLSADGKRQQFNNDADGRTLATRTRIFRASGSTSGSLIATPGDPPPPPPPGGGGGGTPPPAGPPWSTDQWLVDSTVYDALDRVSNTITIAPPDPSRSIAEQRIYTQTDYLGATGLPIRVVHSASDGVTLVDSTHYDAIGRPVARWAQGLTVAESLSYDAASNVVLRKTARGHSITMAYDALNRLTQRATPYVSATIPADTARFTYDPVIGALQSARNADTFIWRQFNSNGLQNYERQEQRTESGNYTPAHSYVTQYEYDVAGRRTTMWHPWQATTGVIGFTTYAYSPDIGALQTVTDPSGSSVTFAYDPRGQLTTLTRPGNVVQRMRYTNDGELALDSIMQDGAVFRSSKMSYDSRGKLRTSINGSGPGDNLSVGYLPMGYTWFSVFSGSQFGVFGGPIASGNTESYVHDALGNIMGGTFANAVSQTLGSGSNSTASSTQRAYTYDNSGRLTTLIDEFTNTFTYDASGNQVGSLGAGSASTSRTDSYNALNQLVASDASTGKQIDRLTTSTRMRYDALGRRVWISKKSTCRGSPEDLQYFCRTNYLRRTAWDGDQELAEWQGQEEDTGRLGCQTPRPMVYPLISEDECPLWGQVLYVNAGAVDAPIAVVRSNYSEYQYANSQWNLRTFPTYTLYPHWTSRGEPDLATTNLGNVLPCTNGASAPPCAQNIGWPAGMTPYMQQQYTRLAWLGSLVENKHDSGLNGGLTYRRNRYLDGKTGRFSQLDPIGLAGGLNSYGYAAGDPANFSDPFGLCVEGDFNCTNLVRMLRAQRGSEFQAAAGIFEKSKGRVYFHDLSISTGGDAVNSDGNPRTFTNGRTRGDTWLRGDVPIEDLLETAVHESVHVGGNESETDGQHAAWRAFGQLSAAAQRRGNPPSLKGRQTWS